MREILIKNTLKEKNIIKNNNMKYKFVSFKDLADGEFTLEIDNSKMLFDYHKKYFSNIIDEYLKELITKEPDEITNWENWDSSFGQSVAALVHICGSLIEAASYIEKESLKTKLKLLQEEGKIYCQDNYGFFTTEDNPES